MGAPRMKCIVSARAHFAVLGAALLLLVAGPAMVAAQSQVVLELSAANENGDSGTFYLTTDNQQLRDGGGYCTYGYLGNYVITDPTTGNEIATVAELTVSYALDPAIYLHFSVVAGPALTNFTITSALQPVSPPIVDAYGRATSAFTLTDGPLGGGATLTGLEGGPAAYLAQYNGFVPGGTTFSAQIDQIIADPRGTRNMSVNDPDPVNYRAVGSAVSDMSAEIKFSLTGRDLASGTTTYEIIPEPAACLLLAAGAIGLRRRRA